MKIKMAYVLLLLASGAEARDPFFLAQASGCFSATDSDKRWRLRGVIGHLGHFNAWLVSPQGQRLRRQQGDPLPGTHWYVADIDAQGMTLATPQNCQPPQRLTLKGRKDVYQDTFSVAGVDKPAVSGTAASEPGF